MECMSELRDELNPADRATYEWQLPVAGFGEAGQLRLKNASVLISRCGGVGGAVAYQLAAAGVGRLVLAHAGPVRPSDLNRQLLMTHEALGQPRVQCAAGRLRELNPSMRIDAVPENISDSNATQLVSQVDVVVDCAPLFEERYAMNRAAVRLGKPMIECAVYELEAHLTTFLPGQTGCLRCLYPEPSSQWTRQFPVFGAVSGAVGGMGAMETIKVLAGFGKPLAAELLTFDLRDMTFRKFKISRRTDCPECGAGAGNSGAVQ
jgi:molybdopterin/thiamine biosynthesis adenylyltransferase